MSLFLDLDINDSILIDKTTVTLIKKNGRKARVKIDADNDTTVLLQVGVDKAKN